MKPTLYFPGLRPNDFFTIGNTIYRNNLFGIQKSVVVMRSEQIFGYRDENESAESGHHPNTYGDPHLFSPEEFTYLEELVKKTKEELKKENLDTRPENVYSLLAKKAKEGDSESLLLFFRMNMMFTGRGLLKSGIEFIRLIEDYKP